AAGDSPRSTACALATASSARSFRSPRASARSARLSRCGRMSSSAANLTCCDRSPASGCTFLPPLTRKRKRRPRTVQAGGLTVLPGAAPALQRLAVHPPEHILQIGRQVRDTQDRLLGLIQGVPRQRDAQNLLDLAQVTVRELPAPFPHRHRVAGDADAAGELFPAQARPLTPH